MDGLARARALATALARVARALATALVACRGVAEEELREHLMRDAIRRATIRRAEEKLREDLMRVAIRRAPS